MTSKEYVDRLDWQSAIAAATLELDKNKTYAAASYPHRGTVKLKIKKIKNKTYAESYLRRGIARCFIPDKEEKHKEAIDDLSKAIAINSNQNVNNDEAYYYRAYAFYLDSNYERAITDCQEIEKNNPCSYRDELFGKIYFAMSKYGEAVDKFKTALSHYSNSVYPPDLLDSYRDACKKMNSV